MPTYDLPPVDSGPSTGRPRSTLRANLWWIAPLLVIDALFIAWWFSRGNPDEEPSGLPPPEPAAHQSALPEPPPGLVLDYPTSRRDLLTAAPESVFMPTGSGRIESAHYGSVRTAQEGKYYLPSFHEGIDLAPQQRDRAQQPLDPILSAIEGRVLYANRIAGNSNYGKYIVLGHADPAGEIYTLYAHLAEVDPAIKPGASVARGQVIGRMGNTASTGLPLARAHLHFEIGVINNSQFHAWYRKQRLKPDHGNYHGHNLTGINPLDALAWQEQHGHFNLKDYLESLEPAFTYAFKTRHLPDYFTRYPSLWSGEPFSGHAVVLQVSEGGVPISGRNATAEELGRIGRHGLVLSASETALGRNGLRLVVKKKGQWTLGRDGERWLEILAYP